MVTIIILPLNVNNIFKIVLIQLDVGPYREKNLAKARRLSIRAARDGADVICLPELFSYMGSFKKPRDVAETRNGPSIRAMKEIAAEHDVHIVAGTILEKTAEGNPKNTCFLISPKGKIISRYSKMHLFDIHVPGKIRFEESKFMRPGKSASVAKTPFGTFGFAICNDIRYPELFRKMISAGAEVIFLPAAFTKFTGRDHWLALNKVRAIENQCYIVAVNQSGKNVDGVRFFGSSIVIDPWGKILKEGPSKGDAIITCDIDLRNVKKIRRHLPALKKIKKSYPLKKYDYR